MPEVTYAANKNDGDLTGRIVFERNENAEPVEYIDLGETKELTKKQLDSVDRSKFDLNVKGESKAAEKKAEEKAEEAADEPEVLAEAPGDTDETKE